MKQSGRSLLFFLAVLLTSFPVWGQGGQQPADTLTTLVSYYPEKEWDLFGREGVIQMTLQFDMRKYFRNAGKEEPEYQKAILLIQAADTSIRKEVRIKSRGVSRREYCAFPPLKLNVKKTDFDNEYLDEQKTFKVVTHCKNSYQFEGYLLKEYLAYKMYNRLTDMSFRVRLIRMRYEDKPEEGKKPRKAEEKYGFIIEPVGSVAKRNGMINLKLDNLTQQDMDTAQMSLVAMFEYMIGNTDWSIPGRHNMKLLKAMDYHRPRPYPVPYDFDYSGFVNADYAVPQEGLPISSVQQRYYLGICVPERYTDAARELFLKKKKDILGVLEDFPYLGKHEKKQAIRYIEDFYDILGSDGSYRFNIVNGCRHQ